MKRKIVRVQKVRGQCLVTIPRKMAEVTGFNKIDYASLSINAYGDIIVRRLEDGAEEKKDLPGDTDWYNRQA